MIRKALCVLFALVAIGDHIRTGAPIQEMLVLAVLSACILFAAVEYLGRKDCAAAELMGRFTFLISIISLMAVPWPMTQRIFVSVVFMAAGSLTIYAVEQAVQKT